jgi:hypothetical protein
MTRIELVAKTAVTADLLHLLLPSMQHLLCHSLYQKHTDKCNVGSWRNLEVGQSGRCIKVILPKLNIKITLTDPSKIASLLCTLIALSRICCAHLDLPIHVTLPSLAVGAIVSNLKPKAKMSATQPRIELPANEEAPYR